MLEGVWDKPCPRPLMAPHLQPHLLWHIEHYHWNGKFRHQPSWMGPLNKMGLWTASILINPMLSLHTGPITSLLLSHCTSRGWQLALYHLKLIQKAQRTCHARWLLVTDPLTCWPSLSHLLMQTTQSEGSPIEVKKEGKNSPTSLIDTNLFSLYRQMLQ